MGFQSELLCLEQAVIRNLAEESRNERLFDWHESAYLLLRNEDYFVTICSETVLMRKPLLQRRQLGTVMHGTVAIVIKGEVQPLPIRADKTIGIVHAAFGAIDRLRL